jgi:2-desacetyl-2-hydroxyethyl bacteriochlorophyllide A dehydrogenase
MSSMQAAVFCGDGRVELRATPMPRPKSRELCVRLEGCGVCASNLPVWSGRPWFVYPLAPGAPGHEGWGEVVAIGDDVDDYVVGDRVAMLSGNAYAEYDVAPVDGVVRLPETLWGLPLPAEPLACVMNIFRRSDILTGQTIAIVGLGFLGILLLQLARHAGAEVVALTRRPYALEMASAYGAKHAIRTDDTNKAIQAALEISGGRGFPRVIEAAGEQSTLDIASALTSEGGRLVIAGYHQSGPRSVDMQQWNWRGLDVINAHERDPAVCARGLREAVDAVVDGRLHPFTLLTHNYDLGEIGTAFQTLDERPEGFFKATILM